MAEDILSKREPMAVQPGKRFTRRGILQAAAVLVPGTIIGAGVSELLSRPTEANKTSLELFLEQGVKPTDVFVGDIRIIKGKNGIMLNVRSAPNTNQDSSISSWLNIEKFNGVNIQFVDEFLIKNALFVEGEYVDNPAGTKGQKGLWVVGNVGTNVLGIKEEKPKYISHSAATGQLVSALEGKFHKISQFDKVGITLETGQKIPANQLGLVTPQAKPA